MGGREVGGEVGVYVYMNCTEVCVCVCVRVCEEVVGWVMIVCSLCVYECGVYVCLLTYAGRERNTKATKTLYSFKIK